MNPWIEQVIELASANVAQNGGPFAALVVRNGKVIATGVNQVARTGDPTAHAEMVAIRAACRELGSFRLSDCELYASCEPCPMCLGAIYWARPARVFYAASAADAGAAGFDDAFIYRQMATPHSERSIPMIQVIHEKAGQPFESWIHKPDRTAY